MNRYGQEAWASWRVLAPTALGEIRDPSRHFSELGEQAAGLVVEVTLRLAGRDRPGESHLEKVGRLTGARLRAEEMVRADLLTPPPEIVEDLDEGALMGPFELLMQDLQALIDEHRRHQP